MECAQTGQALENPRWRELNWDTVVGRVKLQARPGHALEQEQWICPARVAWGLKPCERKTPELQARLTYTATAVGSYAEAEKMATTWGTPVSDGGLHHQVQKLGQKAPALKLPTPVAAQGEPLLPRSSRASARSKNGKSGSLPHGQRCGRVLGPTVSRQASRLRTILEPPRPDLPAPVDRAGEKRRSFPPLELMFTANFGMHRAEPRNLIGAATAGLTAPSSTSWRLAPGRFLRWP